MKETKHFMDGEIYLELEKESDVTSDTVQDATNISPDEMADKQDSKKRIPVSEIVNLRKENAKVFRMSDGSEQAVFYPEAMHVFNEETKTFDEVDNRLEDEEDGRHYRNKRNRFVARFNKESDSDELFSIKQGVHGISVFAKKPKKKMNKRPAPELKKVGEQKERLCFTDVQSGIEVEYSVRGNGVKEDIIVKEKANVYRYPFILKCKNVVAKFIAEEKKILFLSAEDGNEVFHIPAPFMMDAKGQTSSAVSYEMKQQDDGDILFTVTADSTWMNAEGRVFPVTIDPQIVTSDTSCIETYSWTDGVMYAANTHYIGMSKQNEGGSSSEGIAYRGPHRMYVKLGLPSLPRNPRIKKAELVFHQKSETDSTGNQLLTLCQVTTPIILGNYTSEASPKVLDFEPSKPCDCCQDANNTYTFDITELLDSYAKGEISVANLMLKMDSESNTEIRNVEIFGSGSTESRPELHITYESSYGVNSSYRTHTHELGRFGQGSIDLQCGNLMFDAEDFSWSGNRMPVTLKHLYNSALSDVAYTANSEIGLKTADFSAMKIGQGWKLNVMQSLKPASFHHEGASYTGYVFIDENGAETYFKEGKQTCCQNGNCYHLFEDVNGGEMVYDPCKSELTVGNDIYLFDEKGKLLRITDENKNHMDITYTLDRITSVTDGAGREFGFCYDDAAHLTSITAPDDTCVVYTYSGDLLTEITYPEGKKVIISYSGNLPAAVELKDASGNALYKVSYTYVGNRVAQVAEFGVENGSYITGVRSAYDYSAAAGRTVVETTEPADEDTDGQEQVIKTVYTFDESGEVVSEYVYTEELGHMGVDGEESGIHPHSADGGAGVVSNINNLLMNHNFVDDSYWTCTHTNCTDLHIYHHYIYELYAKFGRSVMRMQSDNKNCTERGISQDTVTLPKGSYTFSAYLRVLTKLQGVETAGVYLKVTDTAGTLLAQSERLTQKDSEFTRLIVPFELHSAQSVKVQILMDGAGVVYADAAQLENNPYANPYNMLINGNFEHGTNGWNIDIAPAEASTAEKFNMTQSLKMIGGFCNNCVAYQTVDVKCNSGNRETFTLSGWAKAMGVPNRERYRCTDSTFRLRALISYYGYPAEEYVADFSPRTEDWQFASVQFCKEQYRAIASIKVFCEYGANYGDAYFDNIQLVRNSIETGLSSSDFVIESDGEEDEVAETAETNTAPEFKEQTDTFGNALTETTFTDGEFGTIYRSFGFDADGNDRVRETDARGNKTNYTVDEDTSRNDEVVDRCGNKTAYEYDDAGRTAKITSKTADNTELANVSYSYDAFDNMTEILRGDGMKYALAYNAFHNLESIKVDGTDTSLVKYVYKNGNGRLKEMSYANGDTMKATYNSVGQMIAEKWFDKNDVLTAYYKYVYDGQGNIVRSIDILKKIEYNYEYEEGRIVRATESNIEFSGEIVTSKSVVNTVKYYYDAKGKMTKKVITPANETEQVIYYENPEEGTPVVKFTADGKTITSHSKTDTFGRKSFDELQLGTGFVSRQFYYHVGEATEEHKNNTKLKSSATTQLVSQIVLSDGRTISYEYDAEERITKVIDSVDGTTEYTYDALGQLLTETVNGTVVNTMTYDNYGNILTKNGVKYTYGDERWKDLLTGYEDQTITYDAQGNPTSYLGNELSWEKGRQMKSFRNTVYKYNSDGIRVEKNVNGIEHKYTLDGIRIACETWGANVLVPLYDNEDSVCGIIYNNIPYYFQKDINGNVIGIVDSNANVVARYKYDAWGVCEIVSDITDQNIAHINPFRYRGYYYDTETGLYYLQSRYYDPCNCRFVSSDASECLGTENKVLECNLFAYCKNNCVNLTDELGYGAIESLVNALSSAISVLENILNMIKNSYYKEKKALENSVKLLTKKQQNYLKDIKALYKQVDKICKYLKWFGYALLFVVLATILATAYKTGASIDRAIVDCVVETIINFVVQGAGDLFNKVARFIPYIGFLIGIIGGWLLQYALSKLFNSEKAKRVKNKFANLIKNTRTSLWNWLTNGMKSLAA